MFVVILDIHFSCSDLMHSYHSLESFILRLLFTALLCIVIHSLTLYVVAGCDFM